jgi:tetratricopeptide (TPR) repeat protein
VRFFPHPLYRWTQSELYPVGAVRYLRAFDDPPRRLFNLYNWGGFLMLHAPGIRVFMDGRANTLYDDRLYGEYLSAYSGREGTRAILWKHEVDAVLVPASAGVARLLAQGPDPWEVAYRDPIAVVLLPPRKTATPRILPSAERVLAGSPELGLYRGRAAFQARNLDEAERGFEQAVALNPLLVSAYGGLLQVATRRKDRARLDQWVERAVKAYPRESGRIDQLSASAYERLGELDAALRALRRAVPRGPFSNPTRVKERIAKLEGRRRADPQGGKR